MTSNQYDNGVDVESDSVEEWESDFDSDDFDDEWDLYDDDDKPAVVGGSKNLYVNTAHPLLMSQVKWRCEYIL